MRFSFPLNFSTKRQLRFARKTKIYDIVFFNFLIISSAGSLLASIKIFTVGKILLLPTDYLVGWPLASCENIVSPSQTSSPPSFQTTFTRAVNCDKPVSKNVSLNNSYKRCSTSPHEFSLYIFCWITFFAFITFLIFTSFIQD